MVALVRVRLEEFMIPMVISIIMMMGIMMIE